MPEWLGPLAAFITILAGVIAALQVGRSRAKDETIEAQQGTISALETRVDTVTADLEDAQRKIAQLNGRVDVLAGQQAEAIAGLLAPKIITGVVGALKSGEWGG